MNTSVAEIKNNLHRLIVETEDVSILNKIQSYFSTLNGKNIDWWDTISGNEKKSINTGLKQLKAGHHIPHSDVKHKVRKLLGKK